MSKINNESPKWISFDKYVELFDLKRDPKGTVSVGSTSRHDIAQGIERHTKGSGDISRRY